jgi:hypothetical protein
MDPEERYLLVLPMVRMQRVQTLTRNSTPSTVRRLRWMFALNARFVCRFEKLTLCPNDLVLPQSSHVPAMIMFPFCCQRLPALVLPSCAARSVSLDANGLELSTGAYAFGGSRATKTALSSERYINGYLEYHPVTGQAMPSEIVSPVAIRAIRVYPAARGSAGVFISLRSRS